MAAKEDALMRLRLIIAIASGLCSAAAQAGETAPPQVYRLSPAERDAVIAKAAQQPERPALLLTPEPLAPGLAPSLERDAILNSSLYGERRVDNRPHGEVGVFVGSGGARGFYGTTGVPLGDSGFAQFSFQNGRLPGFGYGLGPGVSWRYGPGQPDR